MSTNNHAEKSPEVDWQVVLEYAKAKVKEEGSVTLSELVSGLGISQEKALEYMNNLADSEDWETYLIRKR